MTPLNIRAVEGGCLNLIAQFPDDHPGVRLAKDCIEIAALYREAVEALADAASELHSGLPDDAEQTIDAVLAKARIVLGMRAV